MIITTIYSVIIPDAFSIVNQNSSLTFQQQNCSNGSCTDTICFNNNPCKSITSSNNQTSVETGSELPAVPDFLPW